MLAKLNSLNTDCSLLFYFKPCRPERKKLPVVNETKEVAQDVLQKLDSLLELMSPLILRKAQLIRVAPRLRTKLNSVSVKHNTFVATRKLITDLLK